MRTSEDNNLHSWRFLSLSGIWASFFLHSTLFPNDHTAFKNVFFPIEINWSRLVETRTTLGRSCEGNVMLCNLINSPTTTAPFKDENPTYLPRWMQEDNHWNLHCMLNNNTNHQQTVDCRCSINKQETQNSCFLDISNQICFFGEANLCSFSTQKHDFDTY